ncbi:hypothetical protein [Chromobacterium haemolyticum]|uniref:hypothetical protein n=1 Tax=Chromobacterium haemolyticum TaxID=394935 RepID=UPI000D30C105|nr:hypothetical protein [Chromobacterium haemolyticum]PTU68195.1 hypothetical protein DBB33_01385 [Chromobacterium haemolyticum]
MDFDESVVKLRANAKLVKFKFSAAIHLLLFLMLSAFLVTAKCSDFGGRVGQGWCDLNFEQYKYMLLDLGGWLGVGFFFVNFIVNFKRFFDVLFGVLSRRIRFSVLILFLLFVFMFFFIWFSPQLFLHGYGVRSYLTSTLLIYCVTGLLPNGMIFFLWELGYVKYKR